MQGWHDAVPLASVEVLLGSLRESESLGAVQAGLVMLADVAVGVRLDAQYLSQWVEGAAAADDGTGLNNDSDWTIHSLLEAHGLHVGVRDTLDDSVR